MNKAKISRHFGFTPADYRDADWQSVLNEVAESLAAREMVAIAGPFGTGKSTMRREVIAAMSINPDKAPVVIQVMNQDVEKLRMPSILAAILRNPEVGRGMPMRRDMEARSVQVNTRLGETAVTQKRLIILIIENAHDLHANTILATKNLRELEFKGQTPLFAVLLVGQPHLIDKINRYGEVKHRCNIVDMSPEASGWMTYQTRQKYLAVRFGGILGDGPRAQIAATANTPLQMDDVVWHALDRAMKAGRKGVDESDFDLPIMIQYHNLKQAGVIGGYSDLVGVTGMSKGTISQTINGHNPKGEPVLKAAMDKLTLERAGQEQRPHRGKMTAAGGE